MDAAPKMRTALRDDLVGVFGPFEEVAQIISVHGPTHPRLFGVVPAPITPTPARMQPAPFAAAVTTSAQPSTQLVLNSMSRLDPPLSAIPTSRGAFNFPSKDATNSQGTSRTTEVENAPRKKDTARASSSANTKEPREPAKVAIRRNEVDVKVDPRSTGSSRAPRGEKRRPEMGMEDLFGEEQTTRATSNDKTNKLDETVTVSPDSGIVDETTDSSTITDSPHSSRDNCMTTIMSQMVHISPAISPVHRPLPLLTSTSDGRASLSCVLDLSILSQEDRDAICAIQLKARGEGQAGKERKERVRKRITQTQTATKPVENQSSLREVKSECSVSPSEKKPRAEDEASTSSWTGCCCADSVAPEEPEKIDMADESHLNNRARSIKHSADRETDRLRRTLYYFESVVYFIVSVTTITQENNHRQYGIIKDTCDLLKQVTMRFVHASNDAPPALRHFTSRVNLLSLRTQALLSYHLYRSREHIAMKNYSILKKLESVTTTATTRTDSPESGCSGSSGRTAFTTPSPVSATATIATATASVIATHGDRETMQRQQLALLHHLMLAHRYWDDSIAKEEELDRDMFSRLDLLCSPLRLESSLLHLAEYLITAVQWLRREYQRESAS